MSARQRCGRSKKSLLILSKTDIRPTDRTKAPRFVEKIERAKRPRSIRIREEFFIIRIERNCKIFLTKIIPSKKIEYNSTML